MQSFPVSRLRPLALAVSCLSLVAASAMAQETAAPEVPTVADPNAAIEEVVVLGRLKSGAEALADERKNSAFAVDLLGMEAISRAGDSDAASALRRVPGLTLVGDKFIYTRGLGERYSSTTLNGAYVPSPDLTRNVVPLDLFPAEIVQSLSVQKSWSPNLPAAFGGGNIDIRTTDIPDDTVIKVEITSGYNSESSDDGLTYSGDDDDWMGNDGGTRQMSDALSAALDTYRGDISPFNILRTLNFDGGTHTLAEAETLNRQLSTELYRDAINLREKELRPDMGGTLALGDRWDIDEDWTVGAKGVVSYANEWRNRDRVNRNANSPESNFSRTQRTVEETDVTGALNLGVDYGDYNSLKTNSMFLRNTEDEASITRGHSAGFEVANNRGFRDAATRFEQRELIVNQVNGSHKVIAFVDETLYDLPLDFARDLSVDWYYSDSKATTDIPNETSIESVEFFDPATGQVASDRVIGSSTAAVFSFSDLTDDVESGGWTVKLPVTVDAFEIEASGGYDYYQKGREFYKYIWNIGTANTPFETLDLPATEVFSDDSILDPDNRMETTIGGLGTESYLAAEKVNAYYGKLDVLWNYAWRLTGGVRWEDFQQASIPIDITQYGLTSGQLAIPVEDLEGAVFQEDEYYPSVALTYLGDLWAEEFQVRGSYSSTVTRPDLREISAASYIDPQTEYRIIGNPNLETTEIDNYDLRADWYFDNGDALSLSVFYKDLTLPIETVRLAGSDDNVVLSFVNAETGEITGAEVEGLKDLSFLFSGLFLQGNLTWSDSEIEISTTDIGLTNNKRPMTNQSDLVYNLQLGYDSPDERHSVMLSFNTFDERVYFAGRDGQGDAYEQPFDSLDLVYSFFPMPGSAVKFKLKNLLDDTQTIEQDGVEIFEQEVGLTGTVEFSWEY